MTQDIKTLAKKLLKLRLAQKIINEYYKKGAFRIPIHLAMGHEAIAVAVDTCAQNQDKLLLTHRNVHYNFLRMSSVRALLNEYLLERSTSQSYVSRGSMNLDNPLSGIIYTSSILGNNLAVGAGVALAQKMKKNNSIPFILTGDGALEEGSFYESLLFLKSTNCPAVVIVENNGWSLATSISERRCHIDLSQLAKSLSIDYHFLDENNVFDYVQKIEEFRSVSITKNSPVLIEVKLSTLGHWILQNQEHINGKFINYHAGPAPKVEISEPFLIEESVDDPVFVTQKYFQNSEWDQLKKDVVNEVMQEGLM